MTTFTSRANVDPKPYYVEESDSRHSVAEVREDSGKGEYGGMVYNLAAFRPRPEFDRSVNPILAVFRKRVEATPRTTVARHASAWLVSFPALLYGTDVTDAQVDHARKVLIRLAERPAS